MLRTVILIVVLIAAVLFFRALWRMRDRLGILGEFLVFLKERKLWWIIPLIVIFALAGILVVASAHSGVAAMIYTLF